MHNARPDTSVPSVLFDWIMERYAVTVDKNSGIRNNPYDWSDTPRYIVDLVKRIVAVSIGSVAIVNTLPALEEKK